MGYDVGMSLQAFLIGTILFVNTAVIPLILAIAFVVFLWNIARYFILKPDDKREEARRTALWGILAFVVIVSIWGVVNLLVTDLGFSQEAAPCPDYNPTCTSSVGRSPECVNGVLCTYDDQGRRRCFAGAC